MKALITEIVGHHVDAVGKSSVKIYRDNGTCTVAAHCDTRCHDMISDETASVTMKFPAVTLKDKIDKMQLFTPNQPYLFQYSVFCLTVSVRTCQ